MADEMLQRRLDSSADEVEVLALTERLEQAQAQALQNPRTGLLNRRGFENAVAESSRAELQNAALLMVDVDHFKRINDT